MLNATEGFVQRFVDAEPGGLPFLPARAGGNARRSLFAKLGDVAGWLQRAGSGVLLTAKSRRLRVQETVSLGEKRFVAILEVDGVSYLIGGGSASVAMLTRLEERPGAAPFTQAMESAWKDQRSE